MNFNENDRNNKNGCVSQKKTGISFRNWFCLVYCQQFWDLNCIKINYPQMRRHCWWWRWCHSNDAIIHDRVPWLLRHTKSFGRLNPVRATWLAISGVFSRQFFGQHVLLVATSVIIILYNRIWIIYSAGNWQKSHFEKENHVSRVPWEEICQFPRGYIVWLPGDSKWPFYPLVGGHLTFERVT